MHHPCGRRKAMRMPCDFTIPGNAVAPDSQPRTVGSVVLHSAFLSYLVSGLSFTKWRKIDTLANRNAHKLHVSQKATPWVRVLCDCTVSLAYFCGF